MRLLATSAAATFSSFCRPFSLTLDSKPNSHVSLATTLSRHRFPRGQLFLLIISSLMRSIYARSACISDGQYLSGHISSSAPIISDLCASSAPYYPDLSCVCRRHLICLKKHQISSNSLTVHTGQPGIEACTYSRPKIKKGK